MITRHFLKTLLIFTTLIAVGLLGVFLISVLNEDSNSKGKDTVSGARVIPKDRIIAN